jgi:hypothetical protein
MHFQVGDLIVVRNSHRIALVTDIVQGQLFLFWQDSLKTMPFSVNVAVSLIEKGKWAISKET